MCRARPEFLVGRPSAAWQGGGLGRIPTFTGGSCRSPTGSGSLPKAAELQWWAVAKVAAVAGVPPQELTRTKFDAASAGAARGMRSGSDRRSGRTTSQHQALRCGGDALSRRRDRWGAAQACPEPGHVAPAGVGERPGQAGGDAAGLRGADARHAAPELDAAHRAHAARVRALAARPGARGQSGPGSHAVRTSSATSATSRRSPTSAAGGCPSARSRASSQPCGSAWSGLPSGTARTPRRAR